ncbi:MAG: flavodoxin family protein [Deltaproteobacteria bacterium]|nr:flavodoxin family protein [Deltaproteobacteria bacterium]
MRILALNGSYRGTRGHTAYLLERVFAGARSEGAECEQIVLAQQRIERCLACDRCQRREPRFRCALDGRDDVRAIFERMAAADIVIYATPVYVFGVSALLKTLLERFYSTGDAGKMRVSAAGLFFHEIDPAICSRPFVTLVCCDNVEDETLRNALEYFRTFSRFMDAPLAGELVRNGGLLCGHGRLDQPSERVQAIYAAFEQAGRELATEGRLLRKTMKAACREVVPVPLFAWLKRIRVRAVKEKFVERAESLRRGVDQP